MQIRFSKQSNSPAMPRKFGMPLTHATCPFCETPVDISQFPLSKTQFHKTSAKHTDNEKYQRRILVTNSGGKNLMF